MVAVWCLTSLRAFGIFISRCEHRDDLAGFIKQAGHLARGNVKETVPHFEPSSLLPGGSETKAEG